MRKVKFIVNEQEEIMEFDDSQTDEEIEEILNEWALDHIHKEWYEIMD